MNQTRGTRHSIRPHHSPESQPEAAPAPVPGREVATTNLTPNLLVLLDSLELLKWSPRSDSSRRPSDYGSDAHSLAASANTRLALSLSTRRDPITGDSNSASRSLRSGVLVGNSSTEVMARHPVLWTSGSRSTASGSLLSSGAVSAPDQRGYSPGARPTTIQAYRMPELVADVVAIADRLDVETFDLVGPDWGGVVAWQLAGRHPDRVATLTAVSTPASAGLCQGAGRWYPGVAVGLHPGAPPPSAARAAVGRAPAVGATPAAGPGRAGRRLGRHLHLGPGPTGRAVGGAGLVPGGHAVQPAVRGPCWCRPLAARAARPGAGPSAAGAPGALEHPARRGRAGPLMPTPSSSALDCQPTPPAGCRSGPDRAHSIGRCSSPGSVRRCGGGRLRGSYVIASAC